VGIEGEALAAIRQFVFEGLATTITLISFFANFSIASAYVYIER
jgi:hypothetical protein